MLCSDAPCYSALSPANPTRPSLVLPYPAASLHRSFLHAPASLPCPSPPSSSAVVSPADLLSFDRRRPPPTGSAPSHVEASPLLLTVPPPVPRAYRRLSSVAATGDGGVGAGRIQRRRPWGRPDPGGTGLGLNGSVHGRSRSFWGVQSTHARGFLLLGYSRRRSRSFWGVQSTHDQGFLLLGYSCRCFFTITSWFSSTVDDLHGLVGVLLRIVPN